MCEVFIYSLYDTVFGGVYMRRDERIVDVPIMDLLILRSNNKTSKARTVPIGRDAEMYYKPTEGKAVLRKKSSRIPSLPQQAALAGCAELMKEAEKKDLIKSRSDVYAFMDYCMFKKGYKGKVERSIRDELKNFIEANV